MLAPDTAWGARHVCHASQSRYAAPAQRTASYAAGTVASSAERPSAAASTWKARPVPVPASETKPAGRPWTSVRETR